MEFAQEEEKQKQKLEVEKQLMPLWLVHFAIKKVAKEEPMDFEEFISKSLKSGNTPRAAVKRTGEEILAEYMPIIEANRSKSKE